MDDGNERAKELRLKGDSLVENGHEEKAVEYYLESAKLGDALSMFAIGEYMFHEDRIPEAVRWFVDAGYAGDKSGYQWAFYVLFGEPEDGDIDDATALEAVCSELLRSYDTEDFERGMKCLEKSFRDGNSGAAFQLGMYYFEGGGCSNEEALKWFALASDAGHTPAMVNLGHMYHKGLGVGKSDKKAFEYYLRAAELGNSRAQYNTGLHCYRGEGTRKSFEKAAYWFAMATEQDHPAACFQLACLYHEGEGVKKSMGKFIELLEKGAELENLDCIHFLGEAYEEGNGVEKSIDRAMELYKKSAARGYELSVEAMERLGNKDRSLIQ